VDALFKQAAYNEIKKSQNSNVQKDLSLKYQVLCEQTSIVGVLK